MDWPNAGFTLKTRRKALWSITLGHIKKRSENNEVYFVAKGRRLGYGSFQASPHMPQLRRKRIYAAVFKAGYRRAKM